MNKLLEPLDRLLTGTVTAAVMRAIDGGGPADALWRTLLDSGFLDVPVPEEDGGAGLPLAQAYPLLALLGRHAVPLPEAAAVLARPANGACARWAPCCAPPR